MGTYIEPFNLRQIFINYFLGDQNLFIYALVIIFSIMAGRFGMSDRTYGVLLAIVSVLFAAYVGESYFIVTLLLVGFFSFKIIAKRFT